MNIKKFAEKMQAAVAASLNKEVCLEEKLKFNGTYSYVIVVTDTENDLSPYIYLEPFFEKFQIDNSIEAAADSIISAYQQNKLKKPVSMKWLRDFSQARDKIFYFLINYEANRKLLEYLPHFRYLDLAMVFGVRYSLDDSRPGSITLYHSHLDIWNTTADELMSLAKKNTPRLCPVRISNLSDHIPGNGSIPSPGDSDSLPEPLAEMYVLSNTYGTYGAAAICYENTLKGFSTLMDADILILPESIHQAVLVPLKKDGNITFYKDMFRSSSEAYPNPQEFLSGHPYIYKRSSGQVETA